MRSTVALWIAASLLLAGCGKKRKTSEHLDGKALLEQKCASCHNLDMPPKTYRDEKAPPMMAVAFHIADFIEAPTKRDKIDKAIDFVKDYVIHPSASKSFCDKASLDAYGVMPSQQGKVSQDELEAIAAYMFRHYTPQNFFKAQEAAARLAAMPKGERLALQNGCAGCHKADRDIVGPSWHRIARRRANDERRIAAAIAEGSHGQWKGSHGAVMPAFASKLSPEEIRTIARWIMHHNEAVRG